MGGGGDRGCVEGGVRLFKRHYSSDTWPVLFQDPAGLTVKNGELVVEGGVLGRQWGAEASHAGGARKT